MQYETLYRESVVDRLESDTGSGGLFAVGSELVSGVYWEHVPDNPTFPLIVINPSYTTQHTDAVRVVLADISVSVYVEIKPTSGVAALDRIEAITSRVVGNWASGPPSYGLERWPPTMVGHGAPPHLYQGRSIANEPGMLHHVLRFTTTITQEG